MFAGPGAWATCRADVGGKDKLAAHLHGKIAYSYLAEDGNELYFFGRSGV